MKSLCWNTFFLQHTEINIYIISTSYSRVLALVLFFPVVTVHAGIVCQNSFIRLRLFVVAPCLLHNFRIQEEGLWTSYCSSCCFISRD